MSGAFNCAGCGARTNRRCHRCHLPACKAACAHRTTTHASGEPCKPDARPSGLSAQQRENVRSALRSLVDAAGSKELAAKAIGVRVPAVTNVLARRNTLSAGPLLRLAGALGWSVEGLCNGSGR